MSVSVSPIVIILNLCKYASVDYGHINIYSIYHLQNFNLAPVHIYFAPLLSQPAWASAIILYPETCTVLEEEEEENFI